MLLTVLCAVPILVVLLMLVCDDRISLFSITPLIQVLNQHRGFTHGWSSGSLTLLALYFPFLFPEVQPQAVFLQEW